jgi:hypothetical protein
MSRELFKLCLITTLIAVMFYTTVKVIDHFYPSKVVHVIECREVDHEQA